MKQLLIQLKDLIQRGILWIFPRLNKILILTIFFTLICILLGCSTTRQIEVVDRVTHDTLYINKVQYDSIYMNDSFLMDYHPSKEYVYLFDSVLVMKVDTMYIRDKKIEYKYKYLHDTCYVHQVDTIPVVNTVEVIKPERYIPWWSKALSWLGGIILLLFILWIALKFIKL